MGWMKNPATWEPDTSLITSEINTLPASVASQLTFQLVSQCGMPKVQAFLADPALSQCTSAYTAAQQATLQNIVGDVIMYNCLSSMMETVCAKYVKATYPLLGLFLG